MIRLACLLTCLAGLPASAADLAEPAGTAAPLSQVAWTVIGGVLAAVVMTRPDLPRPPRPRRIRRRATA